MHGRICAHACDVGLMDVACDADAPSFRCCIRCAHMPSPTQRVRVLALQDVDGASSLYERALHIEPDNVDTLYNYARMLDEEADDKQGALTLLRRAQCADPTSGIRAVSHRACIPAARPASVYLRKLARGIAANEG
jgi:hypothetical protein